MNFYLSSKLVLLSAELTGNDKFLTIHFVLQTPLLFSENAHQLFKLDKVPLTVDYKCFIVKMCGLISILTKIHVILMT